MDSEIIDQFRFVVSFVYAIKSAVHVEVNSCCKTAFLHYVGFYHFLGGGEC